MRLVNLVSHIASLLRDNGKPGKVIALWTTVATSLEQLTGLLEITPL